MSMRIEVGQRFGKLTVLRFSHASGNAIWVCRCDCGKETLARSNHLKSAHTTSCGCHRAARLTKHGGSKHPLYSPYRQMIQRCTNPRADVFRYYGGRGITVCERWRESFANFLSDMGERPPGMELDRINNNGPYAPENCRWATRSEQNMNRRYPSAITFNGETFSAYAWERRLGFKRGVIGARLKYGWTVAEALTTPLLRLSA